ncbi:phospho-sugar mutase [Diaminobutyricibacter tongyongensis]|uniref:Phospho-sugar mutase n=1 Tax=Leifsonia tongyongensis TaxID=1268043 RepID=A0A6L9Y0L2_9MICO|nr:phospho-sugar mutase [Diaminobutyricibacter tongyongensis]NEN06977.1 phospho-sugar mutase [Diaminobutyricibacter tongyongensis]
MAQDPDPETRAELDSLVIAAEAGSAEALDDLHARFDARLAFGTAGLRGEIAAGPNRMNRVLVAQAAAGLASYLHEHAEGSTPSVVIGYDGRKNSAIFAQDTAELMAGAGVRAILLPRLLPTPVLAFAVRHLGTSAGVMVTASHNPPNDNGYKVYLGGIDDGSQIVPPADADIAAHILRVAAAPITGLPRSDAYEVAAESVVDAYIEATAAIARTPSAAVSYVYTAMHGVGWETASRVLERAGFSAPVVVTEQVDPDPRFPTVAFPNPEEPGALDLSFATARKAGVALVVANDPDADRLAIAIPDPSSPEEYRRLTGNEVGALLGWRAAELAEADAATDSGPNGTLACSIVSSPALRAVADAYGLDFQDTLTGFKWVSRATGLIFGFEEALGYLVDPEVVRDKDGISATVAFLDLASSLAADDLTIADQLDRFSERFGHFASDQISLRVTDLADIDVIMARLRSTPPSDVGGVPVSQIDDLKDGFDALPPSDVLRIWLEDGSRVMVRPSGTEPKLKVYIDASSDQGSAAERRSAAESRVRELADGMRALLA